MISNYELTVDEWYEQWFTNYEGKTHTGYINRKEAKEIFAAGYGAGYAECNSQHAWNRLDVLVPQKREDTDA